MAILHRKTPRPRGDKLMASRVLESRSSNSNFHALVTSHFSDMELDVP